MRRTSQKVAGLNALGWRIVDERLSLEEARQSLDAILSGPRYHPALVLHSGGLRHAAFCRLFEGDATAMGLVFIATLAGFYLRQLLVRWRVDGKIVFFLCAFAASLLAAPGVLFHWGTTPQTALAASVLFLIPGIPLINAMLDIMDGHALMGFARARAGQYSDCLHRSGAGPDHGPAGGEFAVTPLLTMLADGFFAAVAAMGFAVISNPPKKVVLVAGALARRGAYGPFRADAGRRGHRQRLTLRGPADLAVQHAVYPALAHSGGDVRLSRAPAHDSGHVRL